MRFIFLIFIFSLPTTYAMENQNNEISEPDFFVDVAIAQTLSLQTNSANTSQQTTVNQANTTPAPVTQANQTNTAAGAIGTAPHQLTKIQRIGKYFAIGTATIGILVWYGYFIYEIALGPQQSKLYPFPISQTEDSISQELESIQNLLKRNC